MKVKWYCGCFKDSRDFFTEPDECCGSGEIDVDLDEWMDGLVDMDCPECGAGLTQDMDHFSLVMSGRNWV